jgi:hypothetical protein
MFSRHPPYRTRALQRYARSREKTVLPRFVTPPVFLCCWLLLGLLLLATVLAWQVQVPIYQGASGVLLNDLSSSQQGTNGWQALLFVPATPKSDLHIGASVTVQIVLTGESFVGTIAAVLPGVLTPEQARQRYALAGDGALVITQPSLVVQLTGGLTVPSDVIAGLSVSAQVPIGNQSLLSLLPHLLSGLLGG